MIEDLLKTGNISAFQIVYILSDLPMILASFPSFTSYDL